MVAVNIVESFPQTSPKLTEKPLADKVRESLAQCANLSCGNARNTCESHSQTTSQKPQVSVIVPVYKVEKYLRACIDSILAQTFTDFELILVDDGSPDNCGAICDEYRSRDERIIVIHKENGGVTAARSDGVSRSRGEWIMFVDSDDKLYEDALSSLLPFTKCIDVDLVEGGRSTHDEFEKNREDCSIVKKSSSFEYVKNLSQYRLSTKDWLPSPWNKLFRKSVFISSRAMYIEPCFWYGEDFLMCLKFSLKMRQGIKISRVIYFYRENENGCLRTRPRTALYLLHYLRKVEEILPGGIYGRFRVVWLSLSRYYFVFMYLTCSDFDFRDEYVKKIVGELKKDKKISIGTRLCLGSINLSEKFQPFIKIIFMKMLNLKKGFIAFWGEK